MQQLAHWLPFGSEDRDSKGDNSPKRTEQSKGALFVGLTRFQFGCISSALLALHIVASASASHRQLGGNNFSLQEAIDIAIGYRLSLAL